jgi:hypothetical protein
MWDLPPGYQPVHSVLGYLKIFGHVIYQPKLPVRCLIAYLAAIIGVMRHPASS